MSNEHDELDDQFADRWRLGELLLHYRRYVAGLSQEELERESGVDDTNISKIEQGITRNPQNSTLQ